MQAPVARVASTPRRGTRAEAFPEPARRGLATSHLEPPAAANPRGPLLAREGSRYSVCKSTSELSYPAKYCVEHGTH